MRINKKISEIIESSGLDKGLALTFLFLYENRFEPILDRLIITQEEEAKIRINLMKLDLVDDQMKLTHPLFETDELPNNVTVLDFKNFTKQVYKQIPESKRARINIGTESTIAFNNLVKNIESIDIDKLIKLTVYYYSNENYCVNIDRFLSEKAILLYDHFEEDRNDIV